jgi:hypothetical protein
MVCMSWNDVCQWVLGRPMGLWLLLLEQLVLHRTKHLVSRDFAAVQHAVKALLTAAITEAATLAPSQPGTFTPGTWSHTIVLESDVRSIAPTPLAGRQQRKRAIAAVDALDGRAWLLRTEYIQDVFDKKIKAALTAALDACQGRQPTRRPMSGGSLSSSEHAVSRALVLEPFVQER